MNNFTTNTYEMKREILNFSEKIANGVNKPTKKFVMEMQYGLAKGGSCLISKIARELDEKIKLNYTIDRLCDNLVNLDSEYEKIIWNNYLKEIKKHINKENPIAIFDDSDMNKEYSRKLEDLDRVIDASSKDKRIVNGYHVCEAVVLSKNTNQPMSVYSKIYSTKSADFKSKNTYTLESIKAVEDLIGKDFTGIFDRGYDDNKVFDYMSKNNHSFIVRLDDKRTYEEYNLMLSYTKATLPYNKEEYTLVIVYGLSEESPMKLLTNLKIKDKKDVIRIARLYLSRWRIEEYFRGKKQEYDFENMRVRTLKSMNNLNMMLSIHLGHIAILADKIDFNLLTIKIIYASKSLKEKAVVWLGQMARGIKEMLKYAHEGIKRWQDIEVKDTRQLSFNF